MTRKRVRPTTKIAAWALGLGVVAATAIWLLWLHAMSFLGWLIIVFVVAGAIYSAAIDQISKERIVNRDHTPPADG